MANHIKLTPEKKEEFYAVIRDTGNVSLAAEKIGITRRYAYQYRDERDDSGEFAKNWDDAYQCFLDKVESTLAKRGFDGVLEPVFYQGVVCGHIRKFSDTASIAILNGRRSEVFRNRMEHSGVVEQRVRLTFGKKKAEK